MNFRALLVACGVVCVAAETGLAVRPDGAAVVLASRVPTHGALLTLPVKVNGDWHQFAVDTGTPLTQFDAMLRDALPPADQPANANARKEPAGTFHPPPTLVVAGTESGRISFQPIRPVACFDFASSGFTNLPFRGILGMDFLVRYAMEIDLDEGMLRLLDPATLERLEYNARLPMRVQLGPLVPVKSHDVNYWAVVATGDLPSLRIEAEVYDYLVEKRHLRQRAVAMINDDGKLSWGFMETGFLRGLELGPFSHRSLYVMRSEPGEDNRLGLSYWRRYRCVFDFPGGTLYLQKGRHFALPDDTDCAGISLRDDDPEEPGVYIRYVALESEARRAGVRPGDRLISIDDSSVENDSAFQIRRRLSFRDEPRRLVLERNGKEIKVTIPLAKLELEMPVAPKVTADALQDALQAITLVFWPLMPQQGARTPDPDEGAGNGRGAGNGQEEETDTARTSQRK